MKNSYRFFQKKSCEYFPCHKVKDSSEFNCLFCYCPLYALGDNCGGNCTYTKEGMTDFQCPKSDIYSVHNTQKKKHTERRALSDETHLSSG